MPPTIRTRVSLQLVDSQYALLTDRPLLFWLLLPPVLTSNFSQDEANVLISI
jgi:hypothetical protein